MTEGGGLTIKDITGRELKSMKELKYLRTVAAGHGALLRDAQHRTKTAWSKRRELPPDALGPKDAI